MSNWFERLGTGGLTVVKWPYPVRYDVENQISMDVLVLGGGPAGCLAAISAARTGARVVLVEKGHPRSSGGTGVDHWLELAESMFQNYPRGMRGVGVQILRGLHEFALSLYCGKRGL